MKTSNPAGAINGTEKARYVFWTGQTNSNDAFVHFKGTLDEVNTYLQNTKVCPIKLSLKETVYVQVEQIDLTSLNTLGLKNDGNENISGYAPPTNNGASNPADPIPNYSEWVPNTIKGNYKSRVE